MSEPVTSCGSTSATGTNSPTAERELHRELLLNNIGFLIDTLTAEHVRTQRPTPIGCPQATPERIARKSTGGGDRCRYTELTRESSSAENSCRCGDPLYGSDDPLDAVAAVVLGDEVAAASERFFDRVPRVTVSRLREQYGTWDEIATLNREELQSAVQAVSPREGVNMESISHLRVLLDTVRETHYTDGTTLTDFSNVQYKTYVNFLSDIPGITESEAWWLVQTAFDKPVWPRDPLIDELLCSLGLLTSNDLVDELGRHSSLEEELIDRQIPALYRALATHAVYEGDDVCGEKCEIRKFLLTHRRREQKKDRDGPTVVDLFAGAGGLSCGLARAGYNVRWAIDVEPDAVATYRLNHPEIPHEHVVCGDVREVDLASRIKQAEPDPDLIVGGPPCQSLSQAGYRSRRAKDEDYSVLDDERTNLYTKYVEAVDELRPRAIVMENVEGMINEVGDTGIRVIDWVLEDLEGLDENGVGYTVDFRLQDMAELGIPQERERILLVGIRNDLIDDDEVVTGVLENLSKYETSRSIRQGLAGLPRLRRGEGGRVLPELGRGCKSEYISENRLHEGTNLCFNHQSREHPMEKDRILFDEALSPGDTGWDVKYNSDGEYAKYIEYDVGTEDNPRFKEKYRKLRWDEPSPTIVAHLAKDANGYVLPDYYEHVQKDSERADKRRNRGITPREAARLQSFPDDYIFVGPFTSWFRQIGNAVPPVAGERLGEVLFPIITDVEGHVGQASELPSATEAISDD